VGLSITPPGFLICCRGYVADEQCSRCVGMPYAPDGGRGRRDGSRGVIIVTLGAPSGLTVESLGTKAIRRSTHTVRSSCGMKRKKRPGRMLVWRMAARRTVGGLFGEFNHSAIITREGERTAAPCPPCLPHCSSARLLPVAGLRGGCGRHKIRTFLLLLGILLLIEVATIPFSAFRR